MHAPDHSPGALRPAHTALRLPSSGLAWWALTAVIAVLTARVTMSSIQLGCTLALVVVTVGLYVRNRTAGLVAMWMVWLLAPFVRRLFLLSEEFTGAEPLALAPFLVTAVIVALEFQQVSLTRRAWRILLLVTGAYLIGLPVGFALAPPAAMFALFAYLTAAGCFVIGYREAADERTHVLPKLLIVVGPLLALYAFRQYYVLPLPEWDELWQEEANFATGGSPEEGRIRVWGTLNSPATFALAMAVTCLCYITMRRLNPLAVVGALAVLAALALTYVRSMWFGFAFALLAIVLISRGSALKRVLPIALVVAALAPIALGGSTQAALGQRATTFADIEADTSAGHRTGISLILLPFALSQPGGTGLGQAGEPTRLGGGGIHITDNGYLAQLLQVGPFGFLLLAIALGAVVRSAVRNAWRRPSGADLLVFGVVAFFVLTLFAGDQLYGLGGMIFWYAAGLGVRRHELAEGATA